MMKDGAGQMDSKKTLDIALQNILRDNDDYTFVKDTALVYLACSENVAHMVGRRSSAELVGRTDQDIFPRELADKYRADDLQVMKSGQPILGMVERLPDINGQEHWTKTWKYPLYDAEQQLLGMYGVSRDVTKVVDLEREAAAARRYLDLIHHLPGGVGILHEEHGGFYLDYANDGWAAVHHMGIKDGNGWQGRDVSEFIYEPDSAAVWAEYERVKANPGTEGCATYRVRGENGELHWLNIRYQRAYEENGRQYYYACYMDVDAQKQTEEKLQESQEMLREAINNSGVQYFTYYPAQHTSQIHSLNAHYKKLPMVWENFPDSFIEFARMLPADAAAYREMVERMDKGADAASCTVRMFYHGVYLWQIVHMAAIRDKSGRTIRVLGYSIDVTARKEAEERLRQERMHLRTLEGNVFEAFSFNLTKNDQPTLQTSDSGMETAVVDEELLQTALRIAPPLGDTNAATRDVLLRAASRIPNPEDRRQFILNCSGDAIRHACAVNHYTHAFRYRRCVNRLVRWVETSIEILPDPETGDLIAFFYTSDVNHPVLQEKIAQYILGRNYETISYCELQTGRISVKITHDEVDRLFQDIPYEKAVELSLEKNVHPNDRAAFRERYQLANIQRALEKTTVYTLYYMKNERCQSLPGQPFRRLKEDIFYLDENRDVLVFLLSDVTAIFEQEREDREKLASALKAAESASIAKSEFLSRMSHEIRTPMNAIIGLDAIALQEKGLSSAMEDHLRKIGISARFLLSLINDILDMSRIESGRMMLKNEPFNFEELVNSINTILYEQCRESSLDYDCVLKSFTEEQYVGDVTKLQQVLVNILGNAVKFTPKGGKIHFMIEQLSRTRDKARLQFEISDTGIGIDEDFVAHLFEPFSQENRGRTSAYGGTGLGLAISKNIISLMGGDISVHSIKNVGTEFTVEVELGLTPESMRQHRLLDVSLKPLFTLIVDDDVIVCQHTQLVLQEAGLKTEWVDSGAGAVERVTAQHRARTDYDLVLLDWKMPDMDGIETARRIRQVVGPEVTIIIMTAYDWADIEKRAIEAGVDMFMKKPVFASSVTKAFEHVFRVKKNEEPMTEPKKEYDFSGCRILLAEDNELNAEIATNILTMRNCSVETAGNGAEAVESFAAAPAGYYAAILMDVRMPVMDGLEATKIIRAMRKSDSKTIPIIAMTANAFQEDVNQSLDSGMNAHLAKPIEPPLLYETLAKFIALAKKNAGV